MLEKRLVSFAITAASAVTVHAGIPYWDSLAKATESLKKVPQKLPLNDFPLKDLGNGQLYRPVEGLKDFVNPKNLPIDDLPIEEYVKVTEGIRKGLGGVKGWNVIDKQIDVVPELGGFGVGDWRGYLPEHVDWRNFLPNNFAWWLYLPKDFDWQLYLKPDFSQLPLDALHWEEFFHHAFDWKHLVWDMGYSWKGHWAEILHEKFPNFNHLAAVWIIPAGKGLEVFHRLPEFFATQKLINAGFDWRKYLVPGVDFRHFILPKYNVAMFLKDDFDWRGHLPLDVDWRHHLPLDFDWKGFLIHDLANLFPEKLDWGAIIPKQLPKNFEWEPFLLTVLHYQQFLPHGFAWKQVIPVGKEWIEWLKEYDWDEFTDWFHELPDEFRRHFYVDEIVAKFHDVFGHLYDVPETVQNFLGQLKGVIDWSEFSKQGGVVYDPKHVYGLLDTLKLNRSVYNGGADDLKVAYLEQLALSWFH